MAQEWFYTKDGKARLGPVSSGELQALAKSGQLLPTDKVCKQGMNQWTAANAVKGLFTKLESTPKSAAAPVAAIAPANAKLGEAHAAANTRPPWLKSTRAKVALIAGGAFLLLSCIAVVVLLIAPSNENQLAEIERQIEAKKKELGALQTKAEALRIKIGPGDEKKKAEIDRQIVAKEKKANQADDPGDQANKTNQVKKLPAELVVAWENADAEIGWMSVDQFACLVFREGAEGMKGEVPAFRFPKWTAGVAAKLPQPQTAFGLDLPGYQEALTEIDLKQLAALKSLQFLKLNLDHNNSLIMSRRLTELAGMKSVQSLSCCNTQTLDAGLKELGGLESLQTLDLSSSEITDAGLKELAGLKSLKSLNLSNMWRVTDAGLKELAALKNLQSLSLRFHPHCTDAGLKELAKLNSLQSLDLTRTGITNAGMKELAGLKNLESLYLGETQVTNAGLKKLAGLKSLKFLDLRGSRVTELGVAELQKALPTVKIELAQLPDYPRIFP